MRQKNGVGARAANADPNPRISSLEPDNSITPENSQQIQAFAGHVTNSLHARPLFLSAQEYQQAGAHLDRLARSYRELKWPEEGALKESITLAAIAQSPSNRATFLRETARLAVILADRFESMSLNAEGIR